MSRPRTFACTTIRRLPFSRLIWFGPSAISIFATDASGTNARVGAASTLSARSDADARSRLRSRLRQRDRQVFERGQVVPHVVGQPHDQVEPTVAFEDLPGLASADRDGDHVLHVGDVQPVAGDGVAVDLDRSSSADPSVCSTFTSAAPGTACSTAAICCGGRLHLLEVVAVHFHRHVAAHAGDQLVEPHLDRLGELVVVPGSSDGFEFDQLEELSPCDRP